MNMEIKKNVFIPFFLPFAGEYTPSHQAKMILQKVNELSQLGFKKVGITYSANHDQSIQIKKCYTSHQWYTGTSGGNQAYVVSIIENLLKNNSSYQHLQNVFHILPITTCAQAGGMGAVQDDWLNEDFNFIKQFLLEGNTAVLGWQNQNTVNDSQHPFAIGGGISAVLTSEQNSRIQTELSLLQQKYERR